MTVQTAQRTPWRARRPWALFAACLVLAGSVLLGGAVHHSKGAPPYNVLFILTDDQTTSELAAMPNVQSLIAAEGVSFKRAYAPIPLCCPARASLLSGNYMHNHGVRGNLPPFGGWERFAAQENDTIATWAHDQSYYTIHIGKYMNGYPTGKPPTEAVPPGWDEWYGKLSEGQLYFNYQLIEKTDPADTPELAFYGDQASEYQTDVFRDKAVGFIDGAGAGETPFMMNLWFNAPHAPFDPAPRHLFSQSGAPLPKLQAFNEKNISDKPKWLRKQSRKPLKKPLRKLINTERRRRVEQLLSVDEGIRQVILELADEGILDETYVIFASDNGYFRGEHRIAGGKFLAYEPSARVPLLIRGPGIPAGATSQELVSLIDVPQTILDIVGASDPANDGRSFLPYAMSPAHRSSRPLLLEADTGPGKGSPGVDPEAASAAQKRTLKAHLAGKKGAKNLDQEKSPVRSVANGNFAPAYKAIRTDRYLYVLYANGQQELYDMLRDPAQLTSQHRNRRFRFVRKWLFGHLAGFTACAGPSCRIEVGPEPRPLRKAKKKPKRNKGGKKKGGGKGGKPPAD
jgi:arylsulfatase A-like enzyme